MLITLNNLIKQIKSPFSGAFFLGYIYRESSKKMSESCCNTTTSNKASNQFDHKDAIQERYGSAALEKESCLCTPVGV